MFFLAINDRWNGTTSYGFGIRTEDLREPRFFPCILLISIIIIFKSSTRSSPLSFFGIRHLSDVNQYPCQNISPSTALAPHPYLTSIDFLYVFIKCSYQRADPNYVMLTPNKEHLAAGVVQNFGKRPLFQSNIDTGNYDHLPRELKPMGKIF